MLKEVAKYGKYMGRDKPDIEDKVIPTHKSKHKESRDIFNPWEIYDYDIDFSKEVYEDESDILEQQSE